MAAKSFTFRHLINLSPIPYEKAPLFLDMDFLLKEINPSCSKFRMKEGGTFYLSSGANNAGFLECIADLEGYPISRFFRAIA